MSDDQRPFIRMAIFGSGEPNEDMIAAALETQHEMTTFFCEAAKKHGREKVELATSIANAEYCLTILADQTECPENVVFLVQQSFRFAISKLGAATNLSESDVRELADSIKTRLGIATVDLHEAAHPLKGDIDGKTF